MKNYFRALFGAQRQIQSQLDDYLDNLNAIALDMRRALGAYLNPFEDTSLEVAHFYPDCTVPSLLL